MSLKNNIAFDIDGTFLDVHEFFKDVIEWHVGKRFEKWISFKTFSEWHGISKGMQSIILEQFYKLCVTSVLVKPIDGAVDFLEKLYIETRDPILFVTSRKRQFAGDTHLVIDRFLNIPYVIAFAEGKNDGFFDKLNYLGNYEYFVEDRRKTALQLSTVNKSVFLIKASYNSLDNVCDKEKYNIKEIDSFRDLLDIPIDLFTKRIFG